MGVLVSRSVLLKHAYVTIIVGPKIGWNLAGYDDESSGITRP